VTSLKRRSRGCALVAESSLRLELSVDYILTLLGPWCVSALRNAMRCGIPEKRFIRKADVTFS